MTGARTLLLVIYCIEALSLIGLSIPLILGRIRPNGWYGFRVKRTLENAAVWYPANRYAAMHLCVLGGILLITAAVLYPISAISFIAYSVVCLTVTLAGLAVVVVRSFRFLRELPP